MINKNDSLLAKKNKEIEGLTTQNKDLLKQINGLKKQKNNMASQRDTAV
jgi:hypothetical protein